MQNNYIVAPPTQVGSEGITYQFTDYSDSATTFWQLLPGEERVRRAPEVQFDTPAGYGGGIYNYDEIEGFIGSLEKYDWKLLGKKELYVPYNNNKLINAIPEQCLLPSYLNPDFVRYEKHRVWVVDATLHPGERNVLAHRRLYVDEDTMTICIVDAWDAKGNLWRINQVVNTVRPDGPGTFLAGNIVNSFLTDDYALYMNVWDEGRNPTYSFPDSVDLSIFDPKNLAADGSY